MALNRFKQMAAALPFAFTAALSSADDIAPASYTPDAQIDTPVQIEKKPVEAWIQAGDYALENAVVAIALYGHGPKLERAQQILEGWFAKRGIPTETFIGENPNGFAAAFFVKGVAYGPTAVQPKVALPNMDRAAEVYPDAWPQQIEKTPHDDFVASIN